MVHTCIPSIQEAEGGVPGQHGLHSETLNKKKNFTFLRAKNSETHLKTIS
jgi:hypothetical protein